VLGVLWRGGSDNVPAELPGAKFAVGCSVLGVLGVLDGEGATESEDEGIVPMGGGAAMGAGAGCGGAAMGCSAMMGGAGAATGTMGAGGLARGGVPAAGSEAVGGGAVPTTGDPAGV
jgi:hypothetical protein